MIFMIFVVGFCQNIYLLLWMVSVAMVYGVHECFIIPAQRVAVGI